MWVRAIILCQLLLSGCVSIGMCYDEARGQTPGEAQPLKYSGNGSTRITVMLVTTKIAFGQCEDIDRLAAVFLSAKSAFEGSETPALKIKDPIIHRGLRTKSELIEEVGNLSADEHTTLICYCKLHGKCTPEGQHILLLDGTSNAELPRTELEHELKKLGARLTILITDSCSAAETLTVEGGVQTSYGFPSQLFVDLFVEPEDLVSINSSSGIVDRQNVYQRAWMDLDGALFTRSFTKMFSSSMNLDALYKRIDANHNGRYSWAEFFKVLQEDTDQRYQTFRSTIIQRGVTPLGFLAGNKKAEVTAQLHQQPRAFSQLPTSP